MTCEEELRDKNDCSYEEGRRGRRKGRKGRREGGKNGEEEQDDVAISVKYHVNIQLGLQLLGC